MTFDPGGSTREHTDRHSEMPTDGPEPAPDGPTRWQRAALLCVVVSPIVVAVVRSIRRDWFPIGDSALLYIRAGDVLTENHPLLGSWTSASLSVGENVNNPGSVYDFLVAPFAHLLPPGPGAAIGVGAVNIATILGISAAARHVGGWAMQRWMLLAAAGLSWAMASELLIDIWQPHALLLPFLLFLVLLVGCTAGRAACVPWTVAVASVLIQTHIGYAYILGLLVLTAGVLFWWLRRPIDRAAVRAAVRSRTAVMTGGVFVLLWIQPLYEQFFGEGTGNLGRLASNSSGGDFTLGASNAIRVVASVAVLPLWWTRPGFSSTVRGTPLTTADDGSVSLAIAGLPTLGLALVGLVVLVVVLGALTRAAHRSGRVVSTCAGALATIAVPAAVLSFSVLTVGTIGLSSHHVRWVWALAVFVHAVLLWLVVDLWVARRVPAVVPYVTPVIVALITLTSVLNLEHRAHPEGPVADSASIPVMRRLLPMIGVLDDVGPVVYDTSTVRVFEPYSSTIMMRMQELGIEFRVDDEVMVRQLGENRRATGDEKVTVFQLEGIPALDYRGDACLVAAASVLSPAEERAARDDADALAAAIVDGSIVVDAERLTPDDPIDQLAAARDGDSHAARLLVLDGTLGRWFGEGVASIGADADLDATDLEARLGRIWTMVVTSFGLFADGLADCPAQDTSS